jgi:hypothetical protein
MSTSHTPAGWDGWEPDSSVGSAVAVGRSFGSDVSVGFSGFGVLVGFSGFGVLVGFVASLSTVGVPVRSFLGSVVLLGRGVSLGGTGVLVGGAWVAVGVTVGLSLGSFVLVFSGTGVWVGGLPGVLVAWGCGTRVSVGLPRGGVTVAPLPGLVVAVGVEASGLASVRAVAVALGAGTGV